MAITKAAKKAIRKNEKRRVVNIGRSGKVKSLLKKVKKMVAEKKAEDAKKILPQVYKILDKAAKTNLLKKNTVSRYKSRITKLINKIK